MSQNDQLITTKKNELLDLFLTEEDLLGTDLLSMSDYFNIFSDKLTAAIDGPDFWDICTDVEGLSGEIASAIEMGIDIAKTETLVADSSHFSREIIEGLKSGAYHIGQSKEVFGNMRPAIVDLNERPVKFFTLKKAIDPSEVLDDISTLSMQTSLQKISSQIEDIKRDVKELIDFSRREALSNKFIYARDKIISASNSTSIEEQQDYLKAADQYLMEGLESLYSDFNAQTEKLMKAQAKFFPKISTIDTILSYISEDIQMIPRYVGLKIYLLTFCGKLTDAQRCLRQFKYFLEGLSSKKLGKRKYTALETIHRYFPYGKDNNDFWLEEPKLVIQTINLYDQMLIQKENQIYFIEAGGDD